MQIHIETGDWKALQHPCERVRLMVFVAEQGVPKAEEIDDLDPVSTHFVAWDEHHMTRAYYARRQNRTFGCA